MIHNIITYGSGGGLVPELIVTAPNGSTVTANALTPTSTIVGTTTTDYIFHNIPLATYSVVATKGTQSRTESVTISEVKQYNLSIAYRLYLYNEGDECTDITGGWSEITNYYHVSGSKVQIKNFYSITKNTDNIVLIAKETGYNNIEHFFYTNNEMDLRGYSSIYINWSAIFSNNNNLANRLQITKGIELTQSDVGGDAIAGTEIQRKNTTVDTTSEIQYPIDIPNLRVVFRSCMYGWAGQITSTIRSIWLE